jgi:hypothetical protein
MSNTHANATIQNEVAMRSFLDGTLLCDKAQVSSHLGHFHAGP